MINDKKITESLSLLRRALKALKASPGDDVLQAAASKAFEVSFEYVWKALKREADQAGYETYNPRDAIKAAEQLRLIGDLDLWFRFLNARNLSVHDYIGMQDKEFVKVMERFAAEAGRLEG